VAKSKYSRVIVFLSVRIRMGKLKGERGKNDQKARVKFPPGGISRKNSSWSAELMKIEAH